MRTLSKADIILYHSVIVEQTGGSVEILNEGMLDQSVNAPFASFGGVDLMPTIEEKAASLCTALVHNHCFVDGNKRIGVASMVRFLDINQVKLQYTDRELYDLGIGLAKAELRKEDVVEWINKHKTNKEIKGKNMREIYFSEKALISSNEKYLIFCFPENSEHKGNLLQVEKSKCYGIKISNDNYYSISVGKEDIFNIFNGTTNLKVKGEELLQQNKMASKRTFRL